MTGESLDPRYDPMFQRGYQGVIAGSAVGSSGSTHQPALPVRPTADAEVHASLPVRLPEQLGVELPGVEHSAAGRPALSTPSPSRPVVTTEIFGEDSGSPHKRRMPNPFIILLWLVGPALVVFSASTLVRMVTEQFSNSTTSSERMALQQLVWVLSPAATTVGLAIIAGLLFWHAANWRRARH